MKKITTKALSILLVSILAIAVMPNLAGRIGLVIQLMSSCHTASNGA